MYHVYVCVENLQCPSVFEGAFSEATCFIYINNEPIQSQINTNHDLGWMHPHRYRMRNVWKVRLNLRSIHEIIHRFLTGCSSRRSKRLFVWDDETPGHFLPLRSCCMTINHFQMLLKVVSSWRCAYLTHIAACAYSHCMASFITLAITMRPDRHNV